MAVKRSTGAIGLLISITIAAGAAAEADQDTADSPAYEAIWKIVDRKGQNQATAVAVGPMWALTNAHVLYDFQRKKSTALVLTRTHGEETVEVTGPIAISATHDIALIETAQPMHRHLRIARSVPLGRADQLHLAGYPEERFATLRATQEMTTVTEASYRLPMERLVQDGFSGGAVLAPNHELIGVSRTASGNIIGVIPAVIVLELLEGAIGARCESRELDSCLDKATRHTRVLAEEGNAHAQYQLGRSHRYIPGARELDLLEQAAMQGNPDAQSELSLDYDQGTPGLGKDLKKAAYWSEEAARQGDETAQINTFIAYYYGDGVARNTETALSWLDRAVKSGAAGAEYYLGLIYQHGEGRPRDPALARYWLDQAAEHGIEEARKALEEIAAPQDR